MQRTRKDVDVLAIDPLYHGKYRMDRYRLRYRTYAGNWSPEVTRETFDRGQSVAILPYDPVRDEVVLIEQFRPGALVAADDYPWLWEIVAGVIEDGETPIEVAKRELQEEAGLVATEVLPIGEFYTSAGACSEYLHLYVGKADARAAGGLHGLIEEVEDIRVFAMPTDDALAALAQGKIRTAPAFAALNWLKNERDNLRKAWR
jgi:ADP-ribose pyrophosphatase